MARRITVKLKVHKASGRLYKTIGKVLGRDGEPKKKVWYFDPADESSAVVRVMELKARWKAITASGGVVWDQDPDYVGARNGESSATTAPLSKPITVDDAAKLYLGQLRCQLDAGQITQAHFDSQRARLTKGIETLAKLPLSVVGEQQLQDTVLRLARRPEVELYRPPSRKPGAAPKAKKTRRMSAVYAKASIATLKWFLSWCDASDLVEWTRPNRFKAIFSIKPVLSKEERQRELEGGTEIDFFSVEELVKLWEHASELQRCLIVLGLNCGFCSAECADLRVTEVKDIIGERPIIERYRRKSIKTAGRGAYARWHLWPETVTYLLQNRTGMNADNVWLLTEDGRRLTDSNSIGQAWKRLTKRAGVRPLGFKYVRKSAAHFVRNVLGFGTEIADMLLAHTDSGMMKFYAGRDWDGRLREATTALRQHVAHVFAADKSALRLAGVA